MDRNEAKEILLSSLPAYLERKGIQINKKFRCLCPEHLDNDPSMHYSKQYNICHCFSCGANANIFRLIEWDYGVTDFKEQFKIGCDLFGLDIGQKKREMRPVKKKPKTKKEQKKASAEVCNNVYRAMKSLMPLTEDDEMYLQRERHLSPVRIREDYFRMPEQWPKNAIAQLRKLSGCTLEQIKTVPGFYVDDNGNLAHSKESGIAILIRDVDGNARAVQIRRDTTAKGRRYTWFSSSFAKSGTSPGAAKDVIIPKHPKKCLCITEGRFKAEVLAAQRNITISVQGVSTWKRIDEMISRIMEKYELNTILLMFDADVMGNIQLLKSLKQMSGELKQKFPDMQLLCGIWKKEDGKGIDDFYFTGKLKANQNILYLDAEKVYSKCLSTVDILLSEHGVKDIRTLPADMKRNFKKELQTRNEEQFFIPAVPMKIAV